MPLCKIQKRKERRSTTAITITTSRWMWQADHLMTFDVLTVKSHLKISNPNHPLDTSLRRHASTINTIVNATFTSTMLLHVVKHAGHSRRLLFAIHHRTLSETTTTTAAAAGGAAAIPRVISRRAWQRHLQKRPPPKSSAGGASKKAEEKPWPVNLQRAGYTACAIFIPYSMAWFLASNGSARALVHSEQLDDALRHHFGQPEDGSTSYYDIRQGQEAHYQLDGELPYNERLQEALIEEMKGSPVKVRVRVDDQEDFVETVLPGATMARSKQVLQELGREEGSVVAIDFGNVIVDNDGTLQEELMQDDEGDSSFSRNEYPVTRQTNIYSLWHYMGRFAAAQQQQDRKRMSSSDVQVARLEHTIQTLQHDLKDVNCTRDRDDMQRELQENKTALRKLKWRKRLGLAK